MNSSTVTTPTTSISSVTSNSSLEFSTTSAKNERVKALGNDNVNPKVSLIDLIATANIPDNFKQKFISLHHDTITKIINNF